MLDEQLERVPRSGTIEQLELYAFPTEFLSLRISFVGRDFKGRSPPFGGAKTQSAGASAKAGQGRIGNFQLFCERHETQV